MGEPTKIIAKASDSTNTTPESVVVVEAKPSVQVTYRFFPANTTKLLAGHNPTNADAAAELTRGRFVTGLVVGDKFEALDLKIRQLPIYETVSGAIVNSGAFFEFSDEARKRRDTLTAQTTNKKLTAAEKTEAKKQLDSEFGHVVNKVRMHVIEVPQRVEPGTTVGVCWGVDAKKKFRQYPHWKVVAGDHDIIVDVFETFGHHEFSDAVLNKPALLDIGTKDSPHEVQCYGARLTGNTWMRSTHPFTEADVDALPKEAASDTVKLALKRIYSVDFEVAKSGDFSIEVASREVETETETETEIEAKTKAEAGEKPDAEKRKVVTLTWILGENSNCIANIKGLDVKAEVPRRIHPAAYAAVARAAHQADVSAVKFTSSWRPMLGSMAHRHGLGLDLKWLSEGKTNLMLNREGLYFPKDETSHPLIDKNKDGILDDARGHHNITIDEQKAFNDWKAAEAQLAASKKAAESALNALTGKTKALAAAKKKKGNDAGVKKAEEELVGATKVSGEAEDARAKADKSLVSTHKEWTDQLAKNEPSVVGRYRRYVMQEACITEVIDPWYVDLNTHDKVDPKPNAHTSGTEYQHRNHMHLTIFDPELKE